MRSADAEGAGCRYQVPRKVPLRIEPKTFFGASRLCAELQPVFCVVGWRAVRTMLPSSGSLSNCPECAVLLGRSK